MINKFTSKTSIDRGFVRPIMWLGVLAILTVVMAACSSGAATTVPVEIPPTEVQPEQLPPPTQPEQAAPAEQPTQVQVPLVNTPWVLVMYGDKANPTVVEAGITISALFGADSNLSGSGGCNTYNTSYQVQGEGLTVSSPIAVTMMACERGMELETFYLDALSKSQSYIIAQNNQLQINYDSGAPYDEVLIYEVQGLPLEGTLWTLTSMGAQDSPQPPAAGANFTARFERLTEAPTGLISGNTGCNEYQSVYFAGIDQMKINLPAKTDNPGCAPELLEQETQYLLALNAVRQYAILGDKLQMRYQNQVLNFTAGVTEAPTPTEAPLAGLLTPLNGTKWWLVTNNNQPVLPGTEITAEFTINPDGTTGSLSGSAGCNSYNAGINGVFTVTPASTTLALCAEPAGIMEQENAYLATLNSSQSISFDMPTLTITGTAGVLIFTNTPPEAPIQPTATEGVPPDENPVAIISGPTEGLVNEELSFDATGSQSGSEIIGYSWDMGDGNVLEGPTVIYSYTEPGQYTVLLTVQNASGIGQASILVTIQ